MSRFGNTDYELYQSYSGPATTTTPTAAAVSMVAGLGPLIVPGAALGGLGSKASSWRLRLTGLATATATVPTWKMGVAKTLTSTAAFTGGFETPTFTPAVVTAALWWLDFELTYRTLSQTNTGVVVVSGEVRGSSLIASPFSQTIPASNGTNTWSDWDIAQTYYLWPYLTLSAATAGNTVTVQTAKLYGEN